MATLLYKHLGISLNKPLSIDGNVNEAASKFKGTFHRLGGFNPIIIRRIYKTFVLPKALYGCELWHILLPKHIDLLEKSHKFCLKFIQSLPRRTSTYLAFSLLNIKRIVYDIN